MNHVSPVSHGALVEFRRKTRTKRRLTLLSVTSAVLCCFASLDAQAAGLLPAGGHFVNGNGSISGSGTTLTINQTSSRGVVDWNSFSIGGNNRVAFANGNGATLNRVTGGSPSAILGTLTASGNVYLINPQGIVVGPRGVISTNGRFVASTLDITDTSAFMNGQSVTLSGNSNAGIVNLGSITSAGGDVFLIARNTVVNTGSISAPNGTAELAVGKQVLLQDSSTGKQVFVQAATGGTLLNAGVIQAAQVSLQAVDGNIYALAANHEAIRATGTATRDGHVWLVAGHQLQAGGAIEATGGTVDMSADRVAFPAGGTTVKADQWNLSASGFTVDGNAARALSTSLGNGTSVNVQTTGANGKAGDIAVNSAIGWQGGASLTLAAYRTLTVGHGATITNQGSGNLTLRADAASLDNGGGVINQGVIDWSRSSGIVSSLYDMNGSYSAGTLLGNAAWTAAPGSGQVTQITAYKLVNNVTDLQNITQDLAGNYALGRDIDATGQTLAPIGNHTTPFTGQFDGMWHSVLNPTVAIADFGHDFSSGLFGVVGQAGVLRDVGVENGSVSTSLLGSGLLAGINQGVIAYANSSGVAAETTQEGTTFGGLVGRNEGTVERSSSSASISGSAANGGLVGYNLGSITQSYATGSVSPVYSTGFGGGLAGINDGTISQSFATGAVQTRLMPTHGVIAFGSGTLASDVYWNTETTGQAASGGSLPAANGLTTAQMSNPASFAGYDFGPNGVWRLPAGASHPVLREPAAQ
ncbi:MAG TPA: filamentous hemagglutinin N-terminal domain-containing protein [Paraburkholderia sp.]|nr:filamentous hemagglutinin N-terminal domain-containing protein [Paraburkholderia sp.]